MFFLFLFQLKLGWTEAALVAGARDVGLSPSIVGSFPRKEAALVEVHFLLFHISIIFTVLSVNSFFLQVIVWSWSR